MPDQMAEALRGLEREVGRIAGNLRLNTTSLNAAADIVEAFGAKLQVVYEAVCADSEEGQDDGLLGRLIAEIEDNSRKLDGVEAAINRLSDQIGRALA